MFNGIYIGRSWRTFHIKLLSVSPNKSPYIKDLPSTLQLQQEELYRGKLFTYDYIQWVLCKETCVLRPSDSFAQKKCLNWTRQYPNWSQKHWGVMLFTYELRYCLQTNCWLITSANCSHCYLIHRIWNTALYGMAIVIIYLKPIENVRNMLTFTLWPSLKSFRAKSMYSLWPKIVIESLSLGVNRRCLPNRSNHIPYWQTSSIFYRQKFYFCVNLNYIFTYGVVSLYLSRLVYFIM